jgi:CHAT domain-containing protein
MPRGGLYDHGAVAEHIMILAVQQNSILRASRRSRCCCRALRSPAPNRELAGADADGILFALEAQGLNLEGTELVVLSACDTAQGSLDYSEGVFGLARCARPEPATCW